MSETVGVPAYPEGWVLQGPGHLPRVGVPPTATPQWSRRQEEYQAWALHDLGFTWHAIGRFLGVSGTTAAAWAKKWR